MSAPERRRLEAAAALWQAIGWALFALTCQVLRHALSHPPGGP